MKKPLVVIPVLILVMVTAFPAAALTGYSYSKEIRLSGTNRYKEFFLDEEVYRSALPDLADLRILDRNGDPVAYYRIGGSEKMTLETVVYGTQPVRQFKEKNDTIADYRVLPMKENADALANQLRLDLPVVDYLKHIAVYGSYDGIEWHHLADDIVYNAGGRTKTDVQFGEPQRYGYYRIRVLNNPEGITIAGLTARYDAAAATVESYTRTATPVYTARTDGQDTVVAFANSDRLRIQAIRLDDAGGNFDRQYTVGTLETDGSETVLARGAIYNLQFKGLEIRNTTVALPEPVASATLVLRIHNRDDRPLAFTRITAEYSIDKVVFEDIGTGPYRLYFGNPQATLPVYDIAAYAGQIENETRDPAVLGNLLRGQADTGATGAAGGRMALNALLALISVGLVALIAGRMRQLR